jgi:hypothetical protein
MPRLRRNMMCCAGRGTQSLQLHVLERQAAHRLAGCRMDGVEHGGRDDEDRRLADAAPEVVARHDHGLDLGHLGKPHDLVRRWGLFFSLA